MDYKSFGIYKGYGLGVKVLPTSIYKGYGLGVKVLPTCIYNLILFKYICPP